MIIPRIIRRCVAPKLSNDTTQQQIHGLWYDIEGSAQRAAKSCCYFFLRSQIASLSIGRDAIGVATLGDSLIAVGGFYGNPSDYLKIVEKYDADKNEWQKLAPLNFGRAGACVIAVPNVLIPTPPIATV